MLHMPQKLSSVRRGGMCVHLRLASAGRAVAGWSIAGAYVDGPQRISQHEIPDLQRGPPQGSELVDRFRRFDRVESTLEVKFFGEFSEDGFAGEGQAFVLAGCLDAAVRIRSEF